MIKSKGKKMPTRAKLLNGLISHAPPRVAGHTIINWKTPKKAIFDSGKPSHIPFKHDRETYSLACSMNALTIFSFIYIYIYILKD